MQTKHYRVLNLSLLIPLILTTAIVVFTQFLSATDVGTDIGMFKPVKSSSVFVVFCSGSFFVLQQYVKRRLLSGLRH